MTRLVRYGPPFAFRLTIADTDRLRAVADARGMTPAEMAREIISQDIGIVYERRSTRRRLEHGEHLRALLTELWRQGNNLNQVAKRLNGAGCTDGGEGPLRVLSEIEASLNRIERAILDAIGSDDGTRL